MRLIRMVAAAAVAAAVSVASVMVHAEGDGVVAGEGWVRAVPPGSRVSAAYVELENRGSGADRLLAASSPIAGVVELHNVSREGGVMSMYPVESIPLPAGETTSLKPGGYHIMLIDLKRQPQPGERVAVELALEHGGTLALDLPVAATPAMGGGMGHHHPAAMGGGNGHGPGQMMEPGMGAGHGPMGHH